MSVGEFVNDPVCLLLLELPLPAGQQFMIDLLLSSLTVEQDMEEALLTAVAYETQDPAAMLKKAGLESSVALMQLIHQLISNSTVRQLALLNKVCRTNYVGVRSDVKHSTNRKSIGMLCLLFGGFTGMVGIPGC